MTLLEGFAWLYGIIGLLWVLGMLQGACRPWRVLLQTVGYHTPVVGGVLRNLALARFTNALEALYVAGVGLPKGLGQASASCGSVVLQRRLDRARPRLEAGDDLATALAGTGALSATAMGMLETGVESGRLDEMLGRIREQAEYEADQAVTRLGMVLPALVYVGVVLFILFTIVHILGNYIRNINELLQ